MHFLRGGGVRIQSDVVVAGAGHAANIEPAEAFNHAVPEFLEET
jgi:pimeloyl-ACP methyl ester carboxylesterase